MKKLFTFIFILICFSLLVFSISLSPPRTKVFLKDDYNGSVDLRIGNIGSPYLKVINDFDFIFTDKDLYEVKNNEVKLKLYYTLNYKDISPGEHRYLVSFMPASSKSAAVAGVAYSLIVKKSFEDYYANIKMSNTEYIKKDFDGFDFIIDNIGNKTIENAKMELELHRDGNLIDTIKINDISAERQKENKLNVGWKNFNQKGESGVYTYNTVFYYGDNQVAKLSGRFRIGDVHVEIHNFSNQFISEEINSLNLKVFSEWSQEINNLVATYSLFNSGDQRLILSKSPTISIKSWETSHLTGFFDLSKIKSGNYRLKVDLDYDSNEVKGKSSKVFDITINKRNQVLPFLKNNWHIFVIIILFILFLVYLKKHKLTHATTAQGNFNSSNEQNNNSNQNYSDSQNNYYNNYEYNQNDSQNYSNDNYYQENNEEYNDNYNKNNYDNFQNNWRN